MRFDLNLKFSLCLLIDENFASAPSVSLNKINMIEWRMDVFAAIRTLFKLLKNKQFRTLFNEKNTPNSFENNPIRSIKFSQVRISNRNEYFQIEPYDKKILITLLYNTSVQLDRMGKRGDLHSGLFRKQNVRFPTSSTKISFTSKQCTLARRGIKLKLPHIIRGNNNREQTVELKPQINERF